MTRRCSVMRMPVAAQRASMPEELSSDDGFNTVMGFSFTGAASSATARMLRQVASHQKRIQMFPAGLSIITLAASDHGKSGLLIETPRRLIVLFDLQKHLIYSAASEMTEMRQEQVARQAAAAIVRVDSNRQDFRFIRGNSRYNEANDFAFHLQQLNQRIALGQHAVEFAFAPAAMKRRAMQLCQSRRIATGRGYDRGGAGTEESGEPGHHGAVGCADACNIFPGTLASGAR